MDAFKEQIEIGSSVKAFVGLLNSQRELFHSQIDQLQRIVIAQCNLSGVNPLAQEMAAGALSIKIGKRPRDLLNPKAIKYMQAVFSIKDTISKKETREISALFGITATQVREFFVSQKSRVRKQVRLSTQKAIRSNAEHDVTSKDYNAVVPIDPAPLNSIPTTSALAVPIDPVPLNSVGPTNPGEISSTSTHDDIPPGISDLDRHFAENVVPMMSKEETFSGQVKLMEWILQIQDSSLLIWFLTKGGVMILTTWLSQAAMEEQTSVILVILKVLCHLPLHKASPENMSAILQSVNGLRFYRTSDISNRARVLLSRWTKLFAKIQAMKKTNGIKSNADAHSQMLLKQSIVEIMGDDADPDEILGPSNESSENIRRLESSQAPKLMLTSVEDSAKKHMLGPSSSYNRERRKVQLVEQPGQRSGGRGVQPSKTVLVNQSRPMSADDIQKAKMRAIYMQSKYGKKDSSSNGNPETKSSGFNDSSAVQPINSSHPSNFNLRPKTEEQNKSPEISQKNSKLEVPRDSKQKMNPITLLAKCKKIQITWHLPPEIELNELWRVAAGESSKEVDVQKNRNRREKETIYRSIQEIPLNPKEPWDREMDYDDSLTPEIPTEQPPDTDTTEETITDPQVSVTQRLKAAVSSASSSSSSQAGIPEPDLELLAVLLKNPELVFALTSGKAGNLSAVDTVKLLDMIKTGGSGLAGNSNGPSTKTEEKVEVSLPSPTPSSNPGTSAWGPEAVRNPFSKQNPIGTTIGASMHRHPSSITPSLPRHVPHAHPSLPLPQTTNALRPDKHQHHPSMASSLNPPYQAPTMSATTTRLQPNLHMQQPVLSNSPAHPSLYSNREPIENTLDSWRAQQSYRNAYYPDQVNETASSLRGRPSQAYPGNRYVNNPRFETWSPDNSPSRSSGNETSDAYGYRHDRSRQQNSSQGYWDHNRRWRDQGR